MFRLLFLCSTLCIYAQKEYCFQYDNAGNQKEVLLCYGGNAKKAFFEDSSDISKETSNSLRITLGVAPNPARDNVAVYWHHSGNAVLRELVLLSIEGKTMYSIKNVVINKPFHIDISGLSAGYYFLVATFSEGSKKVFKVIKL